MNPFLLVTLLIDAMGFGIIAPVLPRLIMDLTGRSVGEAAGIGGWLIASYALTQFVAAPVLGGLSDRFGRRPVLLGSLLALALDYLLMALAPTLAWLFVGRVIAGAAGATYATANAVVADTTPIERRAASFGLLGAAWGIGFILGPVLGGLLGEMDPRVPFFAAAGLAAANLLLGLAVFRETLAPSNRRPFTWSRANLLGALRVLHVYPLVFTLLGAVLLYRIAHDALPSTWTFFTMQRFGWTEREIGLSLAFIGLMTAIVQGGLIGPLTRALGERRAALLGFSAGALAMAGYALVPNVGWLAVCIAISSLFGLAMPALQSLMSRHIPPNAQGELQGALSGIMSLTAIGSPLLMTQLFRLFSGDSPPYGVPLPGAPFVAAAGMLVGAAVLVRSVPR